MSPEYKKLAYERSTILALVRVAKEKFLPAEGEDSPEVTVECEELARSDSRVPEDAVIDVILKLQRLADLREQQMRKFKFVPVENDDEQEWSDEETHPPSPSKKDHGASGGKGKGKGGKASPHAPARGQPAVSGVKV